MVPCCEAGQAEQQQQMHLAPQAAARLCLALDLVHLLVAVGQQQQQGVRPALGAALVQALQLQAVCL
jgi:hypothetical protein